MIVELNKSEFHNCKGIVNKSGQFEVMAIVEGNNPGCKNINL
ncbi:hypothetical protein [Pseudalkalibacillus decolorationis]|nr:hypothetical protein [Pseudalkalibacillus decolorationis]